MNINSKAKGFVCGAVAAATYGMNPLFTLPLYKEGMSVDSVLFYRPYSWYPDEDTRAIICFEEKRNISVGGGRFTLFRLFFASVYELQAYGCRHCFHYSVCLSVDGGGYYVSVFS